jgi:hypothetical protein
MSDTAAQPWWAEVQHLRPRDAGGTRERRDDAGPADGLHTPGPGRFARPATVTESPLETAVAVAIAEDLPRLDDIDWHDFIDSHAELDDVVGGDVGLGARWEEPARDTGLDALWEEPARPAGRRTVEIRGQVDRAATAPVDIDVDARARARRTAPTPAERFHARPDRVAMWAFLLGVLLIAVAALGAPEADAAVRLLGA